MRGNLHRQNTRYCVVLSTAFAVVVGSASCMLPKYDAQTDKRITVRQTDTDTLIIHLISLDDQIESLKASSDSLSKKRLSSDIAKAAYRTNITAYNKINVDYITLKTRIDSEPNKSTPHLDKALYDIRDNLFGDNSLKSRHQKGGILDKAYLKIEQGILGTQFSALLTYELVLKAGNSP